MVLSWPVILFLLIFIVRNWFIQALIDAFQLIADFHEQLFSIVGRRHRCFQANGVGGFSHQKEKEMQ